MLVITTALPAMGAIEPSKTFVKQSISNACGKITIILIGNESGIINSKIRFYPSIALILFNPYVKSLSSGWVEMDVEKINEPDNPFNGSYAAISDICGFWRVKYMPPLGHQNFMAKNSPYFLLQENEDVDVYIVLPIYPI